MSERDDLDNRANQRNPNNDAYWKSRGFENGRPNDWMAQLIRAEQPKPSVNQT